MQLARGEGCVGARLCPTPAARRRGGRSVTGPFGKLARRTGTGRATIWVALAVALVAVALPACGGSDDSNPRVLEAGQVDIKLPPGFKVVGNKVVAPSRGSAAPTTIAAPTANASTPPGAPGNAQSTPTTAKSGVPLAKSGNATTDMMVAFGKFRDCLKDLGVKFIGAPDASNPQSPTNDPDYLKSLSTCAARSNIVQALQAAQSEQDNLTPAEIKQRNKAYLKWRDCMVNRGWDIPKPTPDSKGRLFAFSASGGGPQIKAPPGKDLFNSKDLEQCAARVQRATQNQG
jgi:hypothetical protein